MNDFSQYNHLSTEIKLLIIKGQTLVDEAKAKMNDRSYGFDLTSKWELKSDCKTVEKYIRLICNGKATEKHIENLERSIVHLETVLKGLISFFERK